MGMYYGHNKELPLPDTLQGEYGLLYNINAVLDSRNIAPSGCHVPTWAEINTLVTYIGGFSVGGGKLKETGTDHWDFPNFGADNIYLFTGVGNGQRSGIYGYFEALNQYGIHWTTTLDHTDFYKTLLLRYDVRSISSTISTSKQAGCAIRCICDTSDSTITDVDGNIYDVITIGTQKWLSKNLKVKKYRNGENIVNITDDATWVAASTGAWCYYNNDSNYF